MAKVFKLVEIKPEIVPSEEKEKQNLEGGSSKQNLHACESTKQTDDSSSRDSDENSSTSSILSRENPKSNFKDCNWSVFEDVFIISNGEKIYRKKVSQLKKSGELRRSKKIQK